MQREDAAVFYFEGLYRKLGLYFLPLTKRERRGGFAILQRTVIKVTVHSGLYNIWTSASGLVKYTSGPREDGAMLGITEMING